jgi:hypothetical protein
MIVAIIYLIALVIFIRVIDKSLNEMYKKEQKTKGYICPKTKVKCDDECCVSPIKCHIKSWDKIVSTERKI